MNQTDEVEMYSVEEYDSDDPLHPESPLFHTPSWRRYTTRGFVVCITVQLIVIVAAILFVSTSLPGFPEATPPAEAKFVTTSMDRSADPCTDFYQYACGGWIAAQEPLADDESRRTRSFDALAMSNAQLLEQIVTDDWPYIGTAYRLCNDTARLDERGLEPIAEYYTALDSALDTAELFSAAGALWLAGLDAGIVFTAGIGVDDLDPSRYQLSVWQAGLTLPSPAYYSGSDADVLYEWIQAVFAASPHGTISAVEAASVVAFESALSALFYSVEDNRDPYAVVNPQPVGELRTSLGDVGAFFEPMGIDERTVNVGQPNYLHAAALLVNTTSFDTVKLYAKLRLFDATFGLLGAEQRALADALHYEIYGTEPAERSAACTGSVLALFPMLTGKYYVQAVAGQEKETALELVSAIEAAFAEMLADLEWMDAETRTAALDKLAAINNKIAYPDEWPAFDAEFADVELGDFFEMLVTLGRQDLAALDAPVDRSRWYMSPATVNAYYSPNMNEIVFPLAILQPPFFSPAVPAALNYGGFGVVAGHEVSHGFDDSGALFDASGALANWWSEASKAAFDERVACLEAQYSEYSTAEGGHLSGVLTAGENIADAGGLEAAYRAFSALQYPGDAEEGYDMSSGELFFVAYAQTWCEINRPEHEAVAAASDPHSLGRYRVEGVLSDSARFAETFGCAVGERYAEETCVLW